MHYVVRRLGQATGRLSSFDAARDRHMPRRFGAASLFIDDAGPDEEAADPDALPHIPATDPAAVPPDEGDGGPGGP